MSRPLLVLLLLLNGLLAAWVFAWGGDAPWPMPGQTDRDPERVAQQVRPEAMRIVGPTPAERPALAPPEASAASAARAAPTLPSAASAAASRPQP